MGTQTPRLRSIFRCGGKLQICSVLLLSGTGGGMDIEPPLPVPDVLQCSGPNFDPRWSILRNHLRHGVVAAGNHPHVEVLAETLALEAQDKYAYETFDLVLKQLKPDVSLDGFCHHGFVAALAVVSLALARRGAVNEALLHLDTARNLLGKRLHLDFLESSGWGVHSLDLNHWIKSLASMPEEQMGKSVILRPFHAQMLPRPPPLYEDQEQWRFRRQGTELMLKRRLKSAHGLHLSAFGVHAALLMEPIAMLRVLVPQLRAKVFMRDCPRENAAQEHHCQLQCEVLGDCEDTATSDPARQMYLDIIHHFEQVMFHDGPEPRYFAFGDLLGTVAEMYRSDSALRAADLYVCTAPLMCSILRPFSKKPFLAYLGMQLHVRVDEQKDQLLLMHFQEMVKNSQENAFAVHNFAMREQIAYATGVRLEVVRPHSLYAFPRKLRKSDLYSRRGPACRLWLRPPAWDWRVLFFRSRYFKLSLFVQVFDRYLQAFKAHTKSSYPLDVVVVRNSSIFLTFDDIRRFRAAVVFPWDFAPMAFYELYSLARPVIYLPDLQWLWKVQQFTGWIWSQEIGAVELRGLRLVPGGENFSHAFSPWWDVATAPAEQLFYWHVYSDFSRFPHVQRTSGIPALLWQLLDKDGHHALARIGMRNYNARTLAFSLGWYRQKLQGLLTTREIGSV